MAINRVPQFIEALTPLTDDKAIKELCDAELVYLRECLGIKYSFNEEGLHDDVIEGSVSGLHKQLTSYRNAVISQIPFTEENSYKVLKVRKYVTYHKAFKHLVKLPIERAVRSEAQLTQIYEDQSVLIPIDPDDLILKACELLKSESYLCVALGLMLLTGRRATEILKTAVMNVQTDSTVIFAGQLKTKDSENAQTTPYEIPVLTDSQTVIEALAKLRQLRDFSALSNEAVHSRTNKSLNESVKRHFKGLIPDIKVASLRSAYACIARHFYDPDEVGSVAAYYAFILGHSKKDVTTAQSYIDFKIAK